MMQSADIKTVVPRLTRSFRQNLFYRVVQIIGDIFVHLISSSNMTQTFLTVSIRRKFEIKPSLKIPPHQVCRCTLPCEISVS